MAPSKCTSCQSPLEPGGKFCGSCGAPVTAKEKQPAPAPPPPPPPPQKSQPKPQARPASTPQSQPVQPVSAPPPPPVSPPRAPQSSQKPKKPRWGCLIAALVVLGIVGCVIVIVAGGVVMLPDFIPDDITDITGTTSGSQTFIDVENLTADTICYVYIAPADSTTWGDNLLSSGETILPNTYVSFYATSGTTVDILAQDCNGFDIDSLYDVYVPEEGLTVTYSPTQ